MAQPPEKSSGSPGGGDWMRAIREVAPYLDLGWRIAVAIVVTVGGGVWLDQRLGTLPLFTIGGMLLGLASAFVQIARLDTPGPSASAGRDAEDPGAVD